MCMLFAFSCTPREIEQESVVVMPRPDGEVQRVLDSIKRELTIKRNQEKP